MRLLIAGGGTGGHIYPALAVARSLSARPDGPELSWLGGHRGLEAAIVRAAGFPLRLLALRSLRSVDFSVHAVLDPIRLAASVPQAMAMLARERPSAIFTTGGYVAIPVLIAAASQRVPVVMWEGNVVPGRSVRATARLANVLAVSFAKTCFSLGRGEASGRPCFVTGTPIRDMRTIDRVAARERLGIGPAARVLLIFGGSQAVRRFNAAVAEALPRLIDRHADALSGREALPPDMRERYRPYPFLRDEMLPALAASDLVVGRAGSSTLAEVTALGLPMVVVPYPHAAGHQRANARVLVDAGAARLVDDEAFDAAALLDAAAILRDPTTHARMAAASRELGRPGAAGAVAEIVLAVAGHGPLPERAALDQLARGIAA